MKKLLYGLFICAALINPAQAYRLGVGGITALSQPAGTYFVAQNGNDGNVGTSSAHPWKTFAKVNAQTFASGTTISFNGGDTFLGTLNITTTNTPAGNLTINSYGTGQAHFLSDNENSCLTLTDVSNVTINNIDCEGPGTLMNSSDAMLFLANAASSNLTGDTITNSTVVGYGKNGINLSSNSQSLGFSNAAITNNLIHDITGRIPAGGTGSPISCIIAVTGNVSLTGHSDHISINGNTIYNCIGALNSSQDTGQGVFLLGVTTGSMSNNLVHDIGQFDNSCGGPSGLLATQSSAITIAFNEVYNVVTFNNPPGNSCDGEGIDLDQFTTNSIVEYNYLHNNTFAELTEAPSSATPNSGNIIRFNIFETGPNDVEAIGFIHAVNADLVYNNTMFVNGSIVGGGICAFLPSGMTNTLVSNNICAGAASGQITFFETLSPGISSGNIITGNVYFTAAGGTANWVWNGTGVSQATWQSDCTSFGGNTNTCTPFGITTNPNLTNAGSGGTCGGYNGTCPTAYDLTASSPAGKGNGINLVTTYSLGGVGSQDFYGNAITASTLPIGAAANK